ncbi:hypothetical protein [Natronococcus occultus]|uniref:hypothetical protein n=1 Tax=Natronococcus occultus TaxID=29288 RepID=UPI00067814E7|nr:hypothetical protein [Natronococcus occultus]
MALVPDGSSSPIELQPAPGLQLRQLVVDDRRRQLLAVALGNPPVEVDDQFLDRRGGAAGVVLEVVDDLSAKTVTQRVEDPVHRRCFLRIAGTSDHRNGTI